MEDNIEVGYKNRESIWYSNPDSEGKMRRYYPDGFISQRMLLYEKDLEKNRLKFNSLVKSGMNIYLIKIN